jgi:hypothetical protein
MTDTYPTADALVEQVHVCADRQITAARRLAAERDIALRQIAALEARIAEVEAENRALRAVNERLRPGPPAPEAETTMPIVRVRSERAARRRRGWRR